jgi:hypothetical protein
MVKHIELFPQWVLIEMPALLYADGCGNISVRTSAPNDVKWIELALNTLSIPYQEYEFYEGYETFIDFEFRMEDIKENCSTLYKRMKAMDAKNKIYGDLIIE